MGPSSPDSPNASTTTAACRAGVHSDRAHRSSEYDIARFWDAREAGEIAVAVAGQGRGGARERRKRCGGGVLREGRQSMREQHTEEAALARCPFMRTLETS